MLAESILITDEIAYGKYAVPGHGMVTLDRKAGSLLGTSCPICANLVHTKGKPIGYVLYSKTVP